MTSDFDTSQIVGWWDDAVRKHGAEPRSYADTRDEIRPLVVAEIRKRARNTDDEADRLIDAVMRPARRGRRDSMRDQIAYLVDSLTTPDGATIDPILDTAFPLGLVKGEDKALRHWTPDDLRTIVQTAYRKGAETALAAKDLDDATEPLLAAMNAQHAGTIGALYSKP